MYDVVVIGAGPAGANAAIEADRLGYSVLLIDEQQSAGGQVWRNKSKSILKAPETETSLKGGQLRTALEQSGVEVKFGCRVWNMEKRDGVWHIYADGDVLTSKALILATGAQERVIPIPGWTLPGVMGLAGATALFKEHMMVHGKNTVVAGSGPLIFYVANEIERLGGHVAAVVSLNSRMDWIKQLPAMITQPKLMWQGIKWVSAFRKKTFWQSAPTRFSGDDQVESVTFKKLDHDWRPIGDEKNIECDSACYGQGLMPEISATRLLGADHFYDEALGGWVPVVDDMGQTSVDGLYACGDNAGVLGALAAPTRGKNAAQAMGQGGVRYDTGNVERFGRAMTSLSIPRKGLSELITPDTTVCRCEGISRAEIEEEIKSGALSANAIKSGTRAGMGPCGGRFCRDTISMISGEQKLATARPPLKPMPINEIADDLDYDDLPIPGVSPL